MDEQVEKQDGEEASPKKPVKRTRFFIDDTKTDEEIYEAIMKMARDRGFEVADRDGE